MLRHTLWPAVLHGDGELPLPEDHSTDVDSDIPETPDLAGDSLLVQIPSPHGFTDADQAPYPYPIEATIHCSTLSYSHVLGLGPRRFYF